MVNKQEASSTKANNLGRFKDLTGNSYSFWKVISFSHKNSRNRPYWNCVCRCGKEKKVEHYSLLFGGTKSCGCFARGRYSNYEVQRRSRNRDDILTPVLYSQYRKGAKKRNVEFSLSYDLFKSLIKEKCFYCGIDPSKEFSVLEYHGYILYNGIDRVDNTNGYLPDNVVPCCETCNRAKLKMTQKDFISWIERVYNYRCVHHE